jgi:hypothetical protein
MGERSPVVPPDTNVKLSPRGRRIFDWWIDHHRLFFDVIVRITGKYIFYYGGYALNQHLGFVPLASLIEDMTGSDENTRRLREERTATVTAFSTRKFIHGHNRDNERSSYHRGTQIVNEIASDIDAKVMGFTGDEGEAVAVILRSFLQTAPEPRFQATIRGVVRGSEYAVIPPFDSGLKYIIVHGFQYRPDKWQLIFTGIYDDHKTQVLSEVSFTDEKVERPAFPISPERLALTHYGIYSIQDLCLQFIAQYDSLKSRDSAKDRVLKTLKRIFYCIMNQLLKKMEIKLNQLEFIIDFFKSGEESHKEYVKRFMGGEMYKNIETVVQLMTVLQKIKRREHVSENEAKIDKCMKHLMKYVKLFQGFTDDHITELKRVVTQPAGCPVAGGGGGRGRGGSRRRKGGTRKLQR